MIKRRDIGIMVALWIMTLGLYGLVWLYNTSDELSQYNKKSDNPLAWVILALIPPLNVFVIWWHVRAVSGITPRGAKKGISENALFLLWFPWLPVVPTVGAILSQMQMNKRATAPLLWPDV